MSPLRAFTFGRFVCVVFVMGVITAAVAAPDEEVEEAEPGAETPPAAAIAEPFPLDKERLDGLIRDALNELTAVEFIDTPLKEALNIIKDLHNIEILLDEAALGEAKIEVDTPINLSLSDVRIVSVLQLILGPLQLDWIVEDGVLKITTVAVSQSTFRTEIYALGTLVGRPEIFGTSQDIANAITKCVSPHTWDTAAGKGSLFAMKGLLVVRQTERQHAEVAGFLKKLRRFVKADQDEAVPAPAE